MHTALTLMRNRGTGVSGQRYHAIRCRLPNGIQVRDQAFHGPRIARTGDMCGCPDLGVQMGFQVSV